MLRKKLFITPMRGSVAETNDEIYTCDSFIEYLSVRLFCLDEFK